MEVHLYPTFPNDLFLHIFELHLRWNEAQKTELSEKIDKLQDVGGMLIPWCQEKLGWWNYSELYRQIIYHHS